MDQLNSIQIAADGKTATMGGGVYVDQVLASLAERNKVAGKINPCPYITAYSYARKPLVPVDASECWVAGSEEDLASVYPLYPQKRQCTHGGCG